MPVGIDLSETNALVAVDADGRELLISGKTTKVRNRRTMQTTQRVQRKLATKKAEGKDTHSVRRVLFQAAVVDYQAPHCERAPTQ